MFVNKHQLIDARHNVGVLKPLTEALPRTPPTLSYQTSDGHHTLPCVGQETPRSRTANQLTHQPTVSSPSRLIVSNSALLTTSLCLRTEEQNVVSISTSCNEEKEETHIDTIRYDTIEEINDIGSVPAVITSQNLSPQNVSTYISSESLSVQRPTSNQENERVLSQPRLPSVQAMDLLKSNNNPSLYQHDSHISDLSSPTSSDSPASVRSVPSIPSSLVDADDVCSVLDNSHDFSSQRGNLSFLNCSSGCYMDSL